MISIVHSLIWGLAWLCMLIGPSAMAAELETVVVARADLQRIYRLDGVAEAINRSTVSAQTPGRVVEINFDVDKINEFLNENVDDKKLRDRDEADAEEEE